MMLFLNVNEVKITVIASTESVQLDIYNTLEHSMLLSVLLKHPFVAEPIYYALCD